MHLQRAVRLGAIAAVTAVTLASLFTAFGDRHGVTKAATPDGQPGASAPGDPAGGGHAASPSMIVTVPAGAGTTPVPPSFLGLSTEYWSLPVYERHMPAFGRVLSSLHVPGDQPLILRIGGNSADHTIWEPKERTLPRWAFELNPAWLQAARTVVNRVSARLILDLNLITDSPAAAARWAKAAQADLPRGSIVGFEVGNEPDIYSRLFWLTALSRRGLDASILPSDVTPSGYAQVFQTYASLLKRFAPSVPLLGPAIANPSRSAWVSDLVTHMRSQLGTVTAHRYPFSACATPSGPNFPTIERVLSERASAGIAKSLARVVAIAHGAGLPFRVTEMNSVTCGGVPGVSDTFATALWAPDALFELVRAGIGSVNVHVRTDAINAAFAFGRKGLIAHPLLYGLILFRRTLEANSRLVHVAVSGRRSPHVRVWAVQAPSGRLHVLVIDKGAHAVTVGLRLPQTGPATVQRLLAPSPAASSGVTLSGQSLNSRGRWIGRRISSSIVPVQGRYDVAVPRFSAALISVGGTLASLDHERARPQRPARSDSVRLEHRHRVARGPTRARASAVAVGG